MAKLALGWCAAIPMVLLGLGCASGSDGGTTFAGGAAGSAGAGNSSSGGRANTGGSATGGARTGTGGSATGGAGTGTGGSSSGSPTLSAGCGKAPAITLRAGDNMGWPYIDDERTRLTVRGKVREFSVYMPPNYDKNKPLTLFFTFHGCGGGKSPSGYIDASHGNGLIIAPQGLVGSCGPGVTGWLRDKGSEDYDFFDAMVDWATKGFCIDMNKIFAGGHSHGGYFSAQLGCWRGSVLRGVSPQSAGPIDMTGCTGQVAALFVHHVDDATVSFADGQKLRDQYLAANHCQSTSTPMSQAPCVQYSGCDKGFPVGFCALTGTIVWSYNGTAQSPHNAPWAWGPVNDTTWGFDAALAPK